MDENRHMNNKTLYVNIILYVYTEWITSLANDVQSYFNQIECLESNGCWTRKINGSKRKNKCGKIIVQLEKHKHSTYLSEHWLLFFTFIWYLCTLQQYVQFPHDLHQSFLIGYLVYLQYNRRIYYRCCICDLWH